MTISEQDFRAWLESKPGLVIVGNINGSRDCPVARFLNETRGSGWIVGVVDYGYKGRRIPCPSWVPAFISDCMDRVSWWRGTVMAFEALAALDGKKPLCKDYYLSRKIYLWIVSPIRQMLSAAR